MLLPALLLPSLLLPAASRAQEMEADRFKDVVITRTELGPGLYMLMGAGGNIVLASGDDGAVLVDDQFAPLTERILASIKEVTDQPVRWVLNTHWHGDHTGGNEHLGASGALIVAHQNVRQRMSTDQVIQAFGRQVPASPDAALPVVTFSEELDLHWGGHDIQVRHVAAAHTDGDAMVRFVGQDVLHTGDVYFNGMYPFIDTGSGGGIDGMIAGALLGLSLAGEATKIVPGHGPLSDRDGLQTYVTMLQGVRDAVGALVKAGETREQIVAAKPSAPWDPTWGGGFMAPDTFVGIVVDGMTR